MGKSLFIAEKPSVAMEFVKALDIHPKAKNDGYVEDDDNVVTWCVGHLVTMSYPEKYNPDLKTWKLEDLPFIPEKYKYEVISDVKKQYGIVSGLLNRKDITKIYYSGDSAREGEYIQRLVRQLGGHNESAEEFRVWIDSQTREEILNGIKNAKHLSEYDNLSDSGYARAIEDYLVGLNFSRGLSIKYGRIVSNAIGDGKYHAIAVGRVMSCVLGMVVERERLIRNTAIIPFWGIQADACNINASWKITDESAYKGSPQAYNDTGLLDKSLAEELVGKLNQNGTVQLADKKKTSSEKAAPLLFNLAELQSECSRLFHISPTETLAIAQSLYEKKLTTYPRTDARVLTTAICKVIDDNINGLKSFSPVSEYAQEIITKGMYKGIEKSKYTDDSKVSDHYAIIPTGQGFENLASLNDLELSAYELICRRFLSIFYPVAKYDKIQVVLKQGKESFFASSNIVADPGYLKVAGNDETKAEAMDIYNKLDALSGTFPAQFSLHEGKSQPPKRYTTGSMILAMENAGQLIDDPELREQIKGSGIGTSATRADVISKLEKISYININKKTQVITPDKLGEFVYEALKQSIPNILVPKYTASWETGLSKVASGEMTKAHYLDSMNKYVTNCIKEIKESNIGDSLIKSINDLKSVYPDIKDTSGTSEFGKTDDVCPICGKPILENAKGFYCSGYKEGCHFSIWKTMQILPGKTIPDDIIHELISTTKEVAPEMYKSDVTSKEVKGFKSKKTGKTFSAKLQLEAQRGQYPKLNFVFDSKH
jgi:DNA topoisomerase-3